MATRMVLAIVTVFLVNTALPVFAGGGSDLEVSALTVNTVVPRYDQITNEAQWATGVTITNNSGEVMYFGTSIPADINHGFAILTNEMMPPGAARNISVYAEVDVLPNGNYSGTQYLLFRKEYEPGWHVLPISYSIEIRGEPPYCSIPWKITYPTRSC